MFGGVEKEAAKTWNQITKNLEKLVMNDKKFLLYQKTLHLAEYFLKMQNDAYFNCKIFTPIVSVPKLHTARL